MSLFLENLQTALKDRLLNCQTIVKNGSRSNSSVVHMFVVSDIFRPLEWKSRKKIVDEILDFVLNGEFMQNSVILRPMTYDEYEQYFDTNLSYAKCETK
jgi:hypothetical protein